MSIEATLTWVSMPLLFTFRLLVRRSLLLPLPTLRPVRVWSRLTVPQSPWCNQKSWDSRFTNHCYWLVWTSSPTSTSELRSPVVVTSLKSTLSDKLLQRVWLLTTKSSLMNNPRTNWRRLSLLTTEPCWSLILEDLNQRNSVVEVLDLDSKNLTVNQDPMEIVISIFYCILYYQHILHLHTV